MFNFSTRFQLDRGLVPRLMATEPVNARHHGHHQYGLLAHYYTEYRVLVSAGRVDQAGRGIYKYEQDERCWGLS